MGQSVGGVGVGRGCKCKGPGVGSTPAAELAEAADWARRTCRGGPQGQEGPRFTQTGVGAVERVHAEEAVALPVSRLCAVSRPSLDENVFIMLEIKDTGFVLEMTVQVYGCRRAVPRPPRLPRTWPLRDPPFSSSRVAARAGRGSPAVGGRPRPDPSQPASRSVSPGHSGPGHRAAQPSLLGEGAAPGQRAGLRPGGTGHGEHFPRGRTPLTAGSRAHHPSRLHIPGCM